MVNPDCVDPLDERGVNEADIRDKLLYFNCGSDTDKEEELVECGVEPDDRDQAGENDSAHGIDPPLQLGTADGCKDTEAIDQQVIPVILPKNVDLGVLALQCPAIEEEEEFGGECHRNGNNRWEMEGGLSIWVPFDNFPD